jgi:hypothetical protein
MVTSTREEHGHVPLCNNNATTHCNRSEIWSAIPRARTSNQRHTTRAGRPKIRNDSTNSKSQYPTISSTRSNSCLHDVKYSTSPGTIQDYHQQQSIGSRRRHANHEQVRRSQNPIPGPQETSTMQIMPVMRPRRTMLHDVQVREHHKMDQGKSGRGREASNRILAIQQQKDGQPPPSKMKNHYIWGSRI